MIRNGEVSRVGDLRIWRLILAAPCQLWSANDSHREGRFKTTAIRKAWREHTYEQIRTARLPKGVARVSFGIVFHFTDAARRDSLNYADTAKPIVDAFGPPFVQKPTVKKPAGAASPGWSLIPDDGPREVESTELSIGALWQDVITADDWTLTRPDVIALDRGWGGVTVVVGERPALPPEAPRKRIPLAKVISSETRRRLALAQLTGDL